MDIKKIKESPIFICGHPKSGTSLLRSLLDSHPQLVVYPEESVFFRRFFPRAKGKTHQEKFALAEKTLIHIFKWNQEKPQEDQELFPGRDYSAIDYETVRKNLENLIGTYGINHPGDWLSSSLLAFGIASKHLSPNTKYWVEKSPYHEHYADMIFSWWQEAKMIHVVRDPRDNYASYRHKHPDWKPEFFSRNWNRSTDKGFTNQEVFGHERYLILRYEDLVTSPEATIQKLTSFLGIDNDPALMDPSRSGQQWSGNSMFSDKFDRINTAPIGRWKTELSAADARTIEWMTRVWFDKIGYDRPGEFYLIAFLRNIIWPIRKRMVSLFWNSVKEK